MGKKIIHEEMFPEIVGLYNSSGKTAACDYLRNQFGIKNPYFVIKRIKHSSGYTYDPEKDRFEDSGKSNADDVFMNLDELCGNSVVEAPQHSQKMSDSRPVAMEKLVHELVSDRLLMLSKYIVLDSLARTIFIDQASLSADGYRVVTH